MWKASCRRGFVNWSVLSRQRPLTPQLVRTSPIAETWRLSLTMSQWTHSPSPHTLTPHSLWTCHFHLQPMGLCSHKASTRLHPPTIL